MGRIDLTKNILSTEFQPNRFVKVPNGLIFLDSNRRRIGRWHSDSLYIEGGFGSRRSGLFDPVDIVSNQLDIYILDRSESKIDRWDAQLNYIHAQPISLEGIPLYPEVFSIDQQGRMAVYSSETQEIYLTDRSSNSLNPFIDLNRISHTNDCIQAMGFGYRDQLAILFDCNNEVQLYSRSGRLERRFSVAVDSPIEIIQIREKWLVINGGGHMQVLGEDPMLLPLNGLTILDAISDGEFLQILTKTHLILFDIHAQP